MIPFFVLGSDLSQYSEYFLNCRLPEDKPRMVHAMVRERATPQDYDAITPDNTFVEHMSRKLLFEEFRRQPTEQHPHDFYHPIVGAIVSRQHVPLVHLLEEHTEPSPLAEALQIRYTSGHLYCSPKALKLAPALLGSVNEELRGGPCVSTEFRKAFLLGRLTLVSDRRGVRTYRFKTNPEDVLERLGVRFSGVQFPKSAAAQLDYLRFNPYFVLEVGDTVSFKFTTPFNETVAEFSTELGDVSALVRAQTLNGDLSQYGDTLLNSEWGPRIHAAIYASRDMDVVPRVAQFTPEEMYKHNIPDHTMVQHAGKRSGVAGILTRRVDDAVHVVCVKEDRFFGKPSHAEILHYSCR